MRAGLADLRLNYDAQADSFDRFFPELVRFVEAQRSGLEREAGQASLPTP